MYHFKFLVLLQYVCESDLKIRGVFPHDNQIGDVYDVIR